MSIRIIGREILSRLPVLDGLFRRFIWSRIFFPENEMRFLNDLKAGAIDVAVDVGAATGSYSWILNRVSKQVYAFEPGKIHNTYLGKVIFGTGIKLVAAAVGNTNGSVSMFTPGTDTDALHSATVSQSNPVINVKAASVNQVEQVTLDTFLAENVAPGRSVDLVKIDVEGYELEVVLGAEKTLPKYHPLVICEIEARHNARYAEVFRYLRGLSYKCYIYRDRGFEEFTGENIEGLQLEEDLKIRLGSSYEPERNRYINNFVFQHAESCIKVK